MSILGVLGVESGFYIFGSKNVRTYRPSYGYQTPLAPSHCEQGLRAHPSVEMLPGSGGHPGSTGTTDVNHDTTSAQTDSDRLAQADVWVFIPVSSSNVAGSQASGRDYTARISGIAAGRSSERRRKLVVLDATDRPGCHVFP